MTTRRLLQNNIDNSTHTYLDINICNNNISETNSNPIPIVFNTKRDANYIGNCSNYYMSCIRWSLDLTLPIIIPQIDLSYNGGNFDPNLGNLGGYKTIYSITVRIQSPTAFLEHQEYIIFVPQQLQIPHPNYPLTSMDDVYRNRYFYIDSVQYWLKQVNIAMKTAWETVKTDWLTTIGTLPIPDVIPFMMYNYDGTFTLNASPAYYTDVSAGSKGEIFFNTAMNGLFNGFSSLLNGYDTSGLGDITNGKNFLILFESIYQTTIFNSVNYIYTLTEYPCVPFFSPVSSIVFTSNGIPVEPSNYTPVGITGATQLAVSNNNLNLQPVITDFSIDLSTGVEGRTITGYIPAGEYRFFDLNSDRGLSDINISVFWKSKLTGGLYPVYLRAGGSGNVKLLFRKKNFFSNEE